MAMAMPTDHGHMAMPTDQGHMAMPMDHSHGHAYGPPRRGDVVGSLSLFFRSFCRPWCAQVGPKGAKGNPMWPQSAQKPARGRPKIDEKSTPGAQGVPGVWVLCSFACIYFL